MEFPFLKIGNSEVEFLLKKNQPKYEFLGGKTSKQIARKGNNLVVKREEIPQSEPNNIRNWIPKCKTVWVCFSQIYLPDRHMILQIT